MWFLRYFPTAQQAYRFRVLIRQNSNVDTVSRVGTIFN
jgi:hypothetical protein